MNASKDSNSRIIIPESNRITGNIGIEYLIFHYRLNIYSEYFQKIEHNLLALPGTKISEIKNILDDNLLGVMLSCVSPENYELNLKELKNLDVPFGFKLNGFKTTKPKNGYTANYLKTKANPNEFLGQRIDLTPEKIKEIAKKFKEHGATIIGGCCETRPSHIEAMAKIK